MGNLRHHAFQLRPSGHARQLRRQFTAGSGAKWRQQFRRGRAGHAGAAGTESQPAQRRPVFQYIPIQRAASGHAGHREAALLLRPGDRQLRYGASQDLASDRKQELPLSRRGFNLSIMRSSSAPAVDGNINSSTFGQVISAAPPRLVQLGAKSLLDTLAPTQVISKRCRALKLPRLSVGERSCGP